MQQLTGLDASFLALETANATGHNLTISDVPGPNVPVYMCGARLVAHHPVPVVCRELIPDIEGWPATWPTSSPCWRRRPKSAPRSGQGND